MAELPDGMRRVEDLRLPRVGCVTRGAGGVGSWELHDASGNVVPEVNGFLRELRATGATDSTMRSYTHDLLRWWRFLAAVDVPWAQASRTEVRDLVLWMRQADNPQRRRSGKGRAAAGTLNLRTGKPYLQLGYAPRTINHCLTVISGFYSFAIDNNLGPLMNPVPSSRRRHGPASKPAYGMRARYRQRTPRPQPRGISEDLLQELFATLKNDRDRALIAVSLSSGARASELLSMTRGGIDAGAGVAHVTPKGLGGSRVWIPVAPTSFVWIARYLATRPPGPPEEPLWWTLREPSRPLGYMALRQVLERANERLGTNLTLHDLRHTFTHRLLDDDRLSLTDVQELTRHRSLNGLAQYSASRLDELVRHLHTHLSRPPEPAPTVGPGYSRDDLKVLFPQVDL